MCDAVPGTHVAQRLNSVASALPLHTSEPDLQRPRLLRQTDRHNINVKVLPWVVEGAGGLGAGKTSGAGTRGVSLNVAIGGGTGYSDTNGGESSNN